MGYITDHNFNSINQESAGKRVNRYYCSNVLRDSCVSEDGRKRNQHQPFMAFKNLSGFVP